MPAQSEHSLESLQASMAMALLASDAAAQAMPATLFSGAHDGAVGLKVHRNTVLGALANALRLTYPAVDRLVGEAFFDRMAVDFARAQPPHAPQLDEYGASFPEFTANFPGTETLAYLQELARFEWQFAALARTLVVPESASPSLLLDDGVWLHFAAPLRLHTSHYPVEQLRAAVLAEDTATLEQMDRARGEYTYALWRTHEGVNVRAVSVASARFLAAAYAGADAAAALAATAEEQGDGIAARILAHEILAAGFVRVQRPRNSQ